MNTKALVEELKKVEQIKQPDWARFVKTGAHRERPPQSPDWWYIRAASILRKLKKPTGVSRLRTVYGGRKNRGMKPEKSYKGSGKIIRVILQQLESAGLVVKDKKGRRLTPIGQKLVNHGD